MGTDGSSSDEWIELYNPSPSPVSLEGWVLRSVTDESPRITLSGTIAAGGYYLLERTDDTTISNIQADIAVSFGQGGLNNAGEMLVLENSRGVGMDQAGNSGAWPAGIVTPRVSMERIDVQASGQDASSWASNNTILVNGTDRDGNQIRGTPRSRNSVMP